MFDSAACGEDADGTDIHAESMRDEFDVSDDEETNTDDLQLEDDASSQEEASGKDGEVLEDEGTRPTLAQYKERWAEAREWHARGNDDAFSIANLCPTPVPQLWQETPEAPFHLLKSSEAQSRLSVCRPICCLEPANCSDGVPRYAHIQGDVHWSRRSMTQLSNTNGFILNRQSGAFMGLSYEETNALHECLCWLRSGSNPIFTKFMSVFESFQESCGEMMASFRAVMPKGLSLIHI